MGNRDDECDTIPILNLEQSLEDYFKLTETFPLKDQIRIILSFAEKNTRGDK